MFRYLRVAASPVDFNDTFNARTSTATVNSEWVSIANFDMIGLIIKTANSSGTSPTLDIKLQMSPDGGTTAFDVYPEDEKSETQATLAQITGNTVAAKFFGSWLDGFDTTDNLDPVVRAVFTIAGTSPSFDITAIFSGKKFRS